MIGLPDSCDETSEAKQVFRSARWKWRAWLKGVKGSMDVRSNHRSCCKGYLLALPRMILPLLPPLHSYSPSDGRVDVEWKPLISDRAMKSEFCRGSLSSTASRITYICEFRCTPDHRVAEKRLKSAYGDPLACLLFFPTMQHKAAKLSFPPINVMEDKWKYQHCAHK